MNPKRDSLWPTAFLWGGVAVIAFGNAPITLVIGAICVAVGLNLGTEQDYKHRFEALENHVLGRLSALESQVADHAWKLSEGDRAAIVERFGQARH